MYREEEQNRRKAYAISFASFLVRNLTGISRINRIVLYGSVAKSISTKESDIDIFIDVEKDTKGLNENINNILEKFYTSKEAIIFKLIGIENDIKLKIGRLDDWEELKRSIMSDGFVLWGRFEAGRPKKTGHKIIFYWSGIAKNRGAFLNKIYGYKTGGRVYEGLLSQVNGIKLGKSCIMVPVKYKDRLIELIKKYRVEAKAIEVFA